MKKYRTCYAPRRMSKMGVQMALEEYFSKAQTEWIYSKARLKIRKYGENSFTVEEA